jgi:phospholipid/cholesterol/gamma-HCH transport system substrate-binding protein
VIARRVKIQLLVFAALAALALTVTGINYVGLDKDLWNPPYTVKAHFASSGGIFSNAEVTYRGVTVGRVGALHLTKDGVIVDLRIDQGKKIPARTHAQVEELSAVGEQYVDLRPYTDQGPFLKDGSTIEQKDTSVPVDQNTVLVDLNALVESVPRDDLATTVDELGKAFDGAGQPLQQLITRGNEVIRTFQGNLRQTIALIEQAKSVLATQIDVSGAFRSFAHDIADVSATLRSSDTDLRRLLSTGVVSATELDALLKDTRGTLGPLLGNLVTVGQIQVARLPGLDELLTLYPRVLSAGERVVQDPSTGARFGLDLDQYPVCTQGYAPPSQQKPPDGSTAQDTAPLTLTYGCTSPLTSGVDVRGSRNAPRPPGDTTDPALGGDGRRAGRRRGRVRPGQRSGVGPERSAVPGRRDGRPGRGARRGLLEVPPAGAAHILTSSHNLSATRSLGSLKDVSHLASPRTSV